jgi:hypothetical protein
MTKSAWRFRGLVSVDECGEPRERRSPAALVVLYWITDGTYQSAFLTTSDGVVQHRRR